MDDVFNKYDDELDLLTLEEKQQELNNFIKDFQGMLTTREQRRYLKTLIDKNIIVKTPTSLGLSVDDYSIVNDKLFAKEIRKMEPNIDPEPIDFFPDFAAIGILLHMRDAK